MVSQVYFIEISTHLEIVFPFIMEAKRTRDGVLFEDLVYAAEPVKVSFIVVPAETNMIVILVETGFIIVSTARNFYRVFKSI